MIIWTSSLKVAIPVTLSWVLVALVVNPVALVVTPVTLEWVALELVIVPTPVTFKLTPLS